MPAQQAPQRLQPPAGPPDPVAQRGAVELDPLPGEDPGLAVQGQEIGVLGHQHVRQQRLGRHPAGDRPLRGGRLHHRLLAGPAAVAGAADHLHPQLGGDDVEHLARVLADDVQAPPQQGQLLSSTSTRTSTRGRCAGRAPRLRRRTRGGRGVPLLAATSSCAASAAADGLLEVLQAELELVGVEPLRAPAELPALQLPDQEPQLLDLGLCRVTLGQDSIALGLQRAADSGAFGGDDFRHMLQLQQQPLRVSWKIIQRQRHGAILLAASQEGQHFRSPGRARARDRAGLQPVPRQALEQRRELAPVSRTTPSAGEGQQNRPASSLLL